MYNGPRALARIWNSGFHHNYTRSGGEGGGIYADPGVVIELRSCTIAKNDSTPDDGEGGGLYLTGTPSEPTSADIANCVIWGNTDSTTDPQAEQIT